MKIDSYDPKAPTPKVGTRWVWEINSPENRCMLSVIEVFWNGEEWMVRTQTLLPAREPGNIVHLNDISRFFEACVPVMPKFEGRFDQFCDFESDRKT